MSDERTRELERAAATGDPCAAEAHARAKVRACSDHGLALQVRGLYEPQGGYSADPAAGIWTLSVGLPRLTLTGCVCASCGVDAPAPETAERLIRQAIGDQRGVDPLRGTFAVTIEATCRSGHVEEEGRLYMRSSAPGGSVASAVWSTCVRCGEVLPYRGTVA